MAEKIEDFGQKIGGAKKDLWKARGLSVSDTENMTYDEQRKYITKDNIWKKPNFEKMASDGDIPREVLFFISEMRKSLPAKPHYYNSEDINKYVNFVTEIRDMCMQLRTVDDIKGVFDKLNGEYFFMEGSYSCRWNSEKTPYHKIKDSFVNIPWKCALQYDSFLKLYRDEQFLWTDDEKMLGNFYIWEYNGENIKAINTDSKTSLRIEMKGFRPFIPLSLPEGAENIDNWQQFTYFFVSKSRKIGGYNYTTLDEAKAACLEYAKQNEQYQINVNGKSRKSKFKPPQLEHIEREGENVRGGRDIEGNDMVRSFGFYGGEFGNWLNENDRQTNLNMSYEAFKDLAYALDISDMDISLGKKLSIAFGARGSGSALAHFEPLSNVINLTKMKGAGSLAHEWGHALDRYIRNSIIDGSIVEKGHTNYFSENYTTELPYRYMPIKDVVYEMSHEVITDEMRKKNSDNLKKIISERFKEDTYYENRNEDIQKRIDNALEKAFETGCSREERDKFQTEDTTPPFYDALKDIANDLNITIYPYFYVRNMYSYTGISNGEIDLNRGNSDYLKASKKLDEQYSKEDKGYWASNVEMFARAFSCYVMDKLAEKGLKNDYLCGHSEYAKTTDSNGVVMYGYPVGAERENINKHFDKLFDDLRTRGIFKHNDRRQQELEQTAEKEETQAADSSKLTAEALGLAAGDVIRYTSKRESNSKLMSVESTRDSFVVFQTYTDSNVLLPSNKQTLWFDQINTEGIEKVGKLEELVKLENDRIAKQKAKEQAEEQARLEANKEIIERNKAAATFKVGDVLLGDDVIFNKVYNEIAKIDYENGTVSVKSYKDKQLTVKVSESIVPDFEKVNAMEKVGTVKELRAEQLSFDKQAENSDSKSDNSIKPEEQLEKITAEISQKKKQLSDNIDSMTAEGIMSLADELRALESMQAEVKKSIQQEPITTTDVDKLHAIEPKRKSVQNLLETEVAAVPKFEAQQADKMGMKSAFEMRKEGGNDWRNDESKSINIVDIEKRILPNPITELRKKEKINTIERGKFANDDTGIEITFGRNTVGETIAKAIQDDKRDRPVEARIAALYQIKDIIKKAVCFDSEISYYDKDTAKNKSPNTLFMHKMYGVFTYDNSPYLAELSIEEMFQKNSQASDTIIGTNTRVYSFKDIKITPVEPRLNSRDTMSNDKGYVPTGVTTISIPHLYSLVKTYDKNFFENEQAVGRQERLDEIDINKKADEVIKKAEENNATALFSIDRLGVKAYYKTDEDISSLIDIAESNKKAFTELDKIGTRIDEVEYAEIEQSDKLKFCIDFDLNDGSAEVTVINGGKGGISDINRNEQNTSRTHYTLRKFKGSVIVDGVQVYEALAAEIDRGTGFVHGKIRVQDYYEQQHPDTKQLAEFLKKEYGVGGHSGEGKISLVSTEPNGMTFTFENGESFRHSWYNVAVMTETRLRTDTYLSDEQKEERAKILKDKKENLSKEEIMFGQVDLARFLAKHTLSSDEWEDMAYPLYERGYLDKHKPSEKCSFGYHLPETELYALAERYHHGDDIRRELALGLLINKSDDNIVDKDKAEFVFEQGEISDRTFNYTENLRHTMNLEYGDGGIKCTFKNAEREFTYEDMGQTFLDLIHEKFEDLSYGAVLDFIKDDIPDISDDTVKELITAFDGATMHGWENGEQAKINRIKKALYDVLDSDELTEKAFDVIAKRKYNVSFDEEKPNAALEKAKQLINDFCEEEYLNGADFSDLHNVGLAHTTLTDYELPIQVTADLIEFRITQEFDGELTKVEQYSSIENMVENGLTGLDFSELIDVPDEVINKHIGADDFKLSLISIDEGSELTCYTGNKDSLIIPSDIGNHRITRIAENAFADNSRLREVTIAAGIKTISEGAFYYCTNLEKVNIPITVTSIGEDAFYGCNKLKEVIIPDNCAISEYSFSHNTKVTKYTFENKSVSIDTDRDDDENISCTSSCRR